MGGVGSVHQNNTFLDSLVTSAQISFNERKLITTGVCLALSTPSASILLVNNIFHVHQIYAIPV